MLTLRSLGPIAWLRNKNRKLCRKGLLNALGIGCRQLVFFRKAPMCPDCRIIGGAECAEFSEQAFA